MILLADRIATTAYRDSNAINQSTLKLYIKGAHALRANLEKAQSEMYHEEPSEYFIIGSAVNDMVAYGMDDFKENYHISMVTKKPSDTMISIMMSAMDKMVEANLPMNSDNYLSIYDEMTKSYIVIAAREHNYQSKWGDAAIAAAFERDCAEYWDDIIKAKGKQVLTLEQFMLCKTMVEALTTGDNRFAEIYNLCNGSNVHHLAFEAPLYAKVYTNGNTIFGKGLIDALYYNSETGLTYIYDIKTTSDPVINFPSSVRRYRYDFQLAYYKYLFKNSEKQEIAQNIFRMDPDVFLPDLDNIGTANIVISTQEPENVAMFVYDDELLQIGTFGRPVLYADYVDSTPKVHVSRIEKINGFLDAIKMLVDYGGDFSKDISYKKSNGMFSIDWNGIM